MFLEILQNSQENTFARVSFLIKLKASTLLKKRLWHMFSCEFCKISKDTFSYKTYLVAASFLWNTSEWLFTGLYKIPRKESYGNYS